MTTILDECVNGYMLVLYLDGNRNQYVYDTLKEAQEHRNMVEDNYEHFKLKEGAAI